MWYKNTGTVIPSYQPERVPDTGTGKMNEKCKNPNNNIQILNYKLNPDKITGRVKTMRKP